MENRAKFGIIHIYRRSVAWEEAGLGIAEEVNSRRVAKFGETITATNLRRAGVDTVTAMKIVGHKSEKMHRRYNSVSEADLLQAASEINTYLTPVSSQKSLTALSH